MREIKVLDRSHIDAYADIAFNAYPSFKDFSEEGMAAYKEEAIWILENDPIVTFYGMFEDGVLIAVMRLFDFEMNCFGKVVPVSGLGFLGVHLMHKKKGVAKAMVDFYETHYRARRMPIGLLLPFRPDFYKRMGYGLGTKMNQYRIPPSRLPKAKGQQPMTMGQQPLTQGSLPSVRYVQPQGLEALLTCHREALEVTHGMIAKFGDEIRPIFGDPFNHVVGSFSKSSAGSAGSSATLGNLETLGSSEERLTGYMVYQFKNAKAGNYTMTDLIVKELVYQTPEDLWALMGFLRTQEDQINLVVINTEDEHFYHLLDNPLNDTHNYIPYGYLETNTQAIGAMYKLFDVAEAFHQCDHRDYNGVSLKVRFKIHDNYQGAPLEDVTVAFEAGKAKVQATLGDNGQNKEMPTQDMAASIAAVDVCVSISIADFSTLFLGVSSVMGLYNLGLLRVDQKAHLRTLDRLFYYPQKPVCYTDF